MVDAHDARWRSQRVATVTGMVVEETLSMWWEERTLCVVESTWSHGVRVSTDLGELRQNGGGGRIVFSQYIL
jgi:hypothetical protein